MGLRMEMRTSGCFFRGRYILLILGFFCGLPNGLGGGEVGLSCLFLKFFIRSWYKRNGETQGAPPR